MPVIPRWTVLSCAAATVLALSACADVTGGSSGAPAPVKTLSAPLAKLVQTDIGEFLVTPRPGTSTKDIQATITRLREMPGVQSAELKNGKVDLQFAGGSTHQQHEKAVKQLAAIGEVEEGV